MRWSLILTAFIAILSTQSPLSFALVTTRNLVKLDKRVEGSGPGIRASSSSYRDASTRHSHAFTFRPDGVTRERIPHDQREAYGTHTIQQEGMHADHAYEIQSYGRFLRDHGTSHRQLPPALQAEARRIVNSPENMIPVPGPYNIGKGQVIKHGMNEHALKTPNPIRDEYTRLSYPDARHTAKRLDDAFHRHGVDFGDDSFHRSLRHTYEGAGILHPGEASPPTSDSGSSHRGSPPAANHGSHYASHQYPSSSQYPPSQHPSPYASSSHHHQHQPAPYPPTYHQTSAHTSSSHSHQQQHPSRHPSRHPSMHYSSHPHSSYQHHPY